MLFGIWIVLFKVISKAKIKVMCIGAILVAVLWRSIAILSGADAYFVSMCPLAHMDAFAIGGLVAFYEKSESEIKENVMKYFVFGFCGVILILVYMSKLFNCSIHTAYCLLKDSENYMSNMLTGNIYLFLEIAAAAILMTALKNRNGKSTVITRLSSYFGGFTYEIYLFHWPVIVILKKIFSNPWINFVLCFAITIIMTIVYRKMRALLTKKQ